MSCDWTSDMERLLRAAVHRYVALVRAILDLGEPYEDIMQDLRIEVVTRMRWYKPDRGKLGTFVYKVVHDELVDILKKLNRPCRSGLQRVDLDELEDWQLPAECDRDNLIGEELAGIVYAYVAAWYGHECAAEFVQAALEERLPNIPVPRGKWIRRKLRRVLISTGYVEPNIWKPARRRRGDADKRTTS